MNQISVLAYGAPNSLVRQIQENPSIAINFIRKMRKLAEAIERRTERGGDLRMVEQLRRSERRYAKLILRSIRQTIKEASQHV